MGILLQEMSVSVGAYPTPSSREVLDQAQRSGPPASGSYGRARENSPRSVDSVSLGEKSGSVDDGKSSPANAPSSGKDLCPEEQKKLQEMKKRDAEVRVHEAAHVAAGGSYVRGGASFTLEAGPDGHNYAVGGKVSIDTSTVSGDPDATIRKMQTVKRAALAPANPSSQDHRIAAAAEVQISKATLEKLKKYQTAAGAPDAGSTASRGMAVDMVV